MIRAAKRRLLVTAVAHRIEQHENRVEHIVDVFTRLPVPKRVNRRRLAHNVVAMPTGDASMVAQFFRYHVLVRVFGGDPDAWLARLEQEGGDVGDDGGDLRFVRWIRSRLRQDPALLGTITAMVDATPFWRAAEA